MRDLIANGAALARLGDAPVGLCWLLRIVTRGFGFVIEDRPSVHRGSWSGCRAMPRVPRCINRIVEMDKSAASTFEIVPEPAPEEDQP